MLTRAYNSLLRSASRTAIAMGRPYSTLEQKITASDAWVKSCYVEIDYTISDDSFVYDAVQRMSAFKVGCLVTTGKDGSVSGVVSERDYLNKIALLGRTSKETKIKEISTKLPNLVTATRKDSVEECMQKMLAKDIRHLPLVEDGKVVGLLSIKDLVKVVLQEKEDTIKLLSDFALGKGAHYGNE
mmetsp:Transcript_35740/g.54969  ORF Transcript_35740/g.54969 Transcript_35740/m.54969 type:complete len:185 (-) Transcript_35740:127-681(-)